MRGEGRTGGMAVEARAPDAAAPAAEGVETGGRIVADPTRLVSLDAFRGATIASMLLVNNPGTWSAIHPPLRHAPWHGWTPTDLIFPFFLFIVGVAMTFSFGRLTELGTPRGALLAKAAKRAAILFLLGLLLHGFPNYLDLSELRIPGVLQRIAIAYLAASVIVLFTGLRTQVAIAAATLLGYWALMTLVPVPGSGAGILEPGRDLGAYIDRAVFGTNHLWSFSRTWDPEGLLSTLPAVGTVMTGVFAGAWMRTDRPAIERALGLFIAGAIGMVAGAAWGMSFPINKNIWTSSYVLFTSGMACQFLGFAYWSIDIRGSRRWATPFVIFGVNAIAAFFLSSLLARILNLVQVGDVSLKAWIFTRAFAPLAAPPNASLLYALAYVLLWLGILTALYRRRIFIKV